MDNEIPQLSGSQVDFWTEPDNIMNDIVSDHARVAAVGQLGSDFLMLNENVDNGCPDTPPTPYEMPDAMDEHIPLPSFSFLKTEDSMFQFHRALSQSKLSQINPLFNGPLYTQPTIQPVLRTTEQLPPVMRSVSSYIKEEQEEESAPKAPSRTSSQIPQSPATPLTSPPPPPPSPPESPETPMDSPTKPPSVIPFTQPPLSVTANKQKIIATLDSIRTIVDENSTLVQNLRQLQRTTLSKSQKDKEKLENLLVINKKINQPLQQQKKEVDQLLRANILDPAEIYSALSLQDDIATLLLTLELFDKEVNSVGLTSNRPCLAALIIRVQPWSKVIFKGKEIGEFIVELLTASSVQYEIVSKVTAHLDPKVDPAKKSEKPAPLLINDEQTMSNFISKFEVIKLNTSTRMVPSNISFTVQVKEKGGGATFKLQSEASYPLIGITNESQWVEAAGKLLKVESLEGREDATWHYFANTLHRHFLTITSQDDDPEPQRKLHQWEFNYIHSRMFGDKATITKKMCDEFWSWFGQVLLSIHFKRKIFELWRDGLIYGFVSKEECQSSLVSAPEGTFLMRFSESNAGAFAIAYATQDPAEKVKHFLVKPEDLGANKTLPDYLRERPQFKFLLGVNPTTRLLISHEKAVALSSFYSKKPKSTKQTGYVIL